MQCDGRRASGALTADGARRTSSANCAACALTRGRRARQQVDTCAKLLSGDLWQAAVAVALTAFAVAELPSVLPRPRARPDAVPAGRTFARTYSEPAKLHGGFELYRTLDADERDNNAAAVAGTQLSMPVLVLNGGALSPPGFVAATYRPFAPALQAVTLPGSGHWLAAEAPDALVAQLAQFFAPWPPPIPPRPASACSPPFRNARMSTSISSRPAPIDEGAYAVALRALAQLDHGARTGDWAPFLAMLHDDLTWFGPVDGFQGLHRGKPSAADLFRHHAAVTRTHWALRNVVANGNEVGFECWTQGTIEGKSYGNQLFMLFVVEGDQVRHFREYAGYLNGVGAFVGRGDPQDGAEAYAYKESHKESRGAAEGRRPAPHAEHHA